MAILAVEVHGEPRAIVADAADNLLDPSLAAVEGSVAIAAAELEPFEFAEAIIENATDLAGCMVDVTRLATTAIIRIVEAGGCQIRIAAQPTDFLDNLADI